MDYNKLYDKEQPTKPFVYIIKGAIEKLKLGATWRSVSVDDNNLICRRATSKAGTTTSPTFFISRCFTWSGNK